MEIKINIPKNDYKYPTEVRESVVEQVCKHIINTTCDNNFNDFILVKDENPCVYYKPNVQYAFNCVPSNGSIRLTTIEMKSVFTALQDAGYYIFHERFSNCESKFHFTKKPYYKNRKCERIEFNAFID